MRKIETIATGKNYSAVSVGKVSEIIEHELPMGPDFTLKGKVFVGQALKATGCEISYQTLVSGQDSGFLHTHKTHEELYIILKGNGTYQVDSEMIPVSEGSIVRVAPDGKRALKNTGNEPLTMICIQYKSNNFTDADSPMTDGVILQDEVKW
jgi:mannose-6-phosphate isomerase-like protein (cupin superfamily)